MSMHAGTPLVSHVVPFHDEVEAIDAFFAVTLPILDSIESTRFEIVYVNGLRDRVLAPGGRSEYRSFPYLWRAPV
ncbi:hypothetical protein NA66_10552 [Burkholderia pyrrocinia]|uniref:Uncharacterized protein n=1 Tax=Burkholderia pyrrocinia TaxID=60550 RepID=A0A318I8C8_BURPY|nr:hypothetical protein NA66_10552 [Burkholderia pyrrocinia]SFW90860.1 hypothetical protein SAMN03159384_07115 [Burkholderia sp. NFACC33-1]SFY46579.1 hypothetical protein SAMN03159408_07121 [Burkholderia sp. NFPP32]